MISSSNAVIVLLTLPSTAIQPIKAERERELPRCDLILQICPQDTFSNYKKNRMFENLPTTTLLDYVALHDHI